MSWAGVRRNVILFVMSTILLTSLIMMPMQIMADPPPIPPGPVLPIVFCVRITDISMSQSDPDGDKFTFEFEMMNWSDVEADGLELSLAQPVSGGVFISAASVDVNGRPLIPLDVDGDGFVTDPAGTEDLEDLNNNGILDDGEDLNNSGRLDNDKPPGNLATNNTWTVSSSTSTQVVWAGAAIPNRDLLGATTTNAANQLIPHFPPDAAGPLGVTSVDGNGVVTPQEAIDDGENVLDGFSVELDDFDEGDTVTLNWILTNDGNPIGTPSSGNGYGFGVINLARSVTPGTLPGVLFLPNSGFTQSQTVFYDNVFTINIALGASPPNPNDGTILLTPVDFSGELMAQSTAPFANPGDPPSGFGPPNVHPFDYQNGHYVSTGSCNLIQDAFFSFFFVSPNLLCTSGLTFDWNAGFPLGSMSVMNSDIMSFDGHPVTYLPDGTAQTSGPVSIPGWGGGTNMSEMPNVTPGMTNTMGFETACFPGCPHEDNTPFIYTNTVVKQLSIFDVVVSGSADGNLGWSNGDMIEIAFEQVTNESITGPLTASELGQVLEFRDANGVLVDLGNSFNVQWIDSAFPGQRLLKITATDTVGNVPLFTVTLKAGSSIVSTDSNQPNLSDTESPLARGNFGTAAPAVPPVLSSPLPGDSVGDHTVYFGTGNVDSTITVRDSTSDTEICDTIVGRTDGQWSCTGTIPTELVSMDLVVSDGTLESDPIVVNVDSTPPAVPVITTSGVIDGKGKIQGTGEVGSTVVVKSDDFVIGTAVVGQDGTWMFNPEFFLAERQHTVIATATDSVGNTSVPSTSITFTVVTTSDQPKEFKTVPVIVNIMENAMFDGDVAEIIKNANKVLSKLDPMTRLVQVGDSIPNVKPPAGITSDGTFTLDETIKVIVNNKKELKNNSDLNGVGFKITFAKTIWSEESAVIGAAPHRIASVILETSGDDELAGYALAHEFGHAITLKHSQDTTGTDQTDDDDAGNTMKSTTAFFDSNAEGEGFDNLEWSETQSETIKKDKFLDQIALPAKKSSPGVLEQFQKGFADDDTDDDTAGLEYTDLLWIAMSSNVGEQNINTLINLNGNFPTTGSFDIIYSLLFDTDADTQTGNTIGTFSGIDKEVIIQIKDDNSNGRFDCSSASATCSAVVVDHSTFQVTHLAQSPQVVDGEVWADFVGIIDFNFQNIVLDIPKSVLSLTATDVPVGVMVRDTLTPFETFTEIDSASFTFDTDRYLDQPTMTLLVETANVGDNISVVLAGLTPNSAFDLKVGETVALADTTDGAGTFNGMVTIPAVTTGDHFLTAQDATGKFAFNLITVTTVPTCTATLSGSEEVPSVSTSASGTATFELNEAQTQLTISASLSGLDLDGLQTSGDSNDDVTGAHIHRGVLGENGPIIFGMINPDDDLNGDLVVDPVAGTIVSAWDSDEGNVTTLTAELTNLLNNGLYLNVHSSQQPSGEIRGQILCQAIPSATVSGTVFADTNDNGIQDGVETGIADVTVILVDGSGVQLPNTTTDVDGAYSFTNVSPGTILVQVAPVPALHLPSTGFNSFAFPTVADGEDLTQDFPLVPITVPSTVSGTVFADTNDNGVQDPGELGLVGVQVFVVDFLTLTQTTVNTDENGLYTASGILPDAVLVQTSPIPDGFLPSTGFNTFVFPALVPGANTVDFPLAPIAPEDEGTIIIDVFNDANSNGIKDTGEGGVAGAVVFTFELLNAVADVQITGVSGVTTHTGLIPDIVLAQINAVVLPAGFTTITTSNAGFEFIAVTAGSTTTLEIGLAPIFLNLASASTSISDTQSFTLTANAPVDAPITAGTLFGYGYGAFQASGDIVAVASHPGLLDSTAQTSANDPSLHTHGVVLKSSEGCPSGTAVSSLTLDEVGESSISGNTLTVSNVPTDDPFIGQVVSFYLTVAFPEVCVNIVDSIGP